MCLAPSANLYSINEGYSEQWTPGLRGFIQGLKDPAREFSQRYIGSLVADFHRNLLKGGLFIYPATAKTPKGKLRLMYEAFPLAFIAECAGGAASSGSERILDMTLGDLHQRTPLFIGNRALVEEAVAAAGA